MRPRAILLLLLLSTTAACTTIKSGVKTTPINDSLLPAQQVLPQVKKPVADTKSTCGQQAIRPTPDTMDGRTWVITDFDQNCTYEVPLTPGRSTMLKLLDGEMFNGNPVGGNVDGFMVTAAYAGSSPALSIVPKAPGVRSNLQVTTSGDDVYNFDLVTKPRGGVNMVEIRRGGQSTGSHGVVEGEPQAPAGATVLYAVTPDGSPLPAWKPKRVWADANRLVITFPAPQPRLPALFAGGNGEQIVRYDVLQGAGTISIVTDIRVTKAQLRIDEEVIEITAEQPETDPNPHGWNQAAELQERPGIQPVQVFILPSDLGNSPVVPVTAEPSPFMPGKGI